MNRLLKLLCLLTLFALPIEATTLTGTAKAPDGTTPVTRMTWQLSQQAAALSTGGCGGPYVVAPTTAITFTLVAGAMPGSATVIGTDCIAPSGLYYIVTLYDVNGNKLSVVNWQPTGASVDIGTLLSIAASPSGTIVTGLVNATNIVVTNLTATSATLSNLLAGILCGAGCAITRSGGGTIDASTLLGFNWGAPGAIGGVTPSTAVFGTSNSGTGKVTIGYDHTTAQGFVECDSSGGSQCWSLGPNIGNPSAGAYAFYDQTASLRLASLDKTGVFNAYAFAALDSTVGGLPSAATYAGNIRSVTDSTAVSAEGQTCVGGSSNRALAYSNGSVWKCF